MALIWEDHLVVIVRRISDEAVISFLGRLLKQRETLSASLVLRNVAFK